MTDKTMGSTTRSTTRSTARSTMGRRTGTRRATFRGEPGDNTVELHGRVSSQPVERELPSGMRITTFRMSVPRARTAMTAGSSQSVDWVDCAAWTARSRRTVTGWAVGDPVEVTGALRRRFFRSGGGSSTRLEIEVLTARRGRAPDPESELDVG